VTNKLVKLLQRFAAGMEMAVGIYSGILGERFRFLSVNYRACTGVGCRGNVGWC